MRTSIWVRKGMRTLAAALAGVMLLAAAGCGGGKGGAGGDTGGKVTLNGAGATFPYPLYSKWMDVYSRANPGVRINYQSIGSGGGIRQITAGTVDFGASDAPMQDEELAKAPGILHIPTVLGAVVLTYNLPSVDSGLKLDADVIADIFLGQITRWNDARIARLNPGVKLPAQEIVVVTRSDGSGTTYVFTDYLSAVSDDWKARVGTGKSVKWPVGIGGKGNEGVTSQVKQTPGAIGYVELAYAVENRMAVATLKNRAGTFIMPSLDSVTAAAAGSAASMPGDLRVSIVNAPGDGAYPIASYTYLLVFREQADAAKGKALAGFIDWSLREGAEYAKDLRYAPLPDNVRDLALEKVHAMTANGRPLIERQ